MTVMLLLLDDLIRGCYRRFRGLTVCLSVCLSRSCVVLKRQKISTRFLLHTTAHVSFRPCQNFAYVGQPLPPEILPQIDPSPVDLSVGDIRWQIAVEWLEVAQWLQWRAYRKPPSRYRMVPSPTQYDLLLPKMGVPRCRYLPH